MASTPGSDVVPPKAYALALSLRPRVLARIEALKLELTDEKKLGNLNALLSLLAGHKYGINMSIVRCLDFVRSGSRLNAYQYVASLNLNPRDSVKRLKTILGEKWYRPRRYIDRLLMFTAATHYAALNLGGAGPERYGECCVVLDPSRVSPYVTCLSGDSIQAVFSGFAAGRQQVLEHQEILDLFGVHEDADSLAALGHIPLLKRQNRFPSKRELRAIFEQAESCFEVHLHGPVHWSQVDCVVMSERLHDELWDLTAEYALTPPHRQTAQKFQRVAYFMELMSLRDDKGLPFAVAEFS